MSKFRGRDIIDINDFTNEEIIFILKTAKKFDPDFVKRNKQSLLPRNKADYLLLRGKIAGLLFFEPSTRTEQSFRSAAQRVGMGVIGFNDPDVTSLKKGESFLDTMRVMSAYADVLIIRHPRPGSVKEVADLVDIPVINAGDGPNSHPTQTLLDIYTILKILKRLDHLKIAFVGDPLHYRTFHGQLLGLSKFSGNKFYGISPKGLEMPKEFRNSNYQDVVINMKRLDETLAHIKPDVVSAGRIPEEYIQGDAKKYTFKITVDTVKRLPAKTLIMHPLPRVGEIDTEVDSFPNAVYFQQVKNGLFVREAILSLVLGAV